MANISMNAQQWESVDATEQEKIRAILQKAGSIQEGDRIVGDPSIAPFSADIGMQIQGWNPIKDLCKIGCDTAAGAAVAACTAGTAGAGLVVCLAAAEAARQYCRGRC